MKNAKRLGLALAALAFLAPTPFPEKREFQLPFGKTLNLDLESGGRVKISGWDKELVSVRAFLEKPDREFYDVEFHSDASGGQLRIFFDNDWKSSSVERRFDVQVPKRSNLSISSIGGGVYISALEGEINGGTDGGEIVLDDLRGRVHLRTNGGNISVTNSRLDGDVRTGAGEVVMKNVTGSLKGFTGHGKVSHKETAALNKDEVRISSQGGAVHVDEAPGGADLRTGGGDIVVVFAKEYVKARTMGGNIRIEKVDGWVEAQTNGGDIFVKMIGDTKKPGRNVYLSSNSGDITLILPESNSAEFDLTLAYTKDIKRSNFGIVSDFPLKQRGTENWDYSIGTPRKYFYGTGQAGGGKNKIRIETVNGDIYLKKEK